AVRSRVHEVHLHGVVEPVERVLRWRVEVELEKSPRRAVDLDRVALVDVGLDRVAVVHEMQARHPVPEGEIWEVLRLDGSWRLRPEGGGRRRGCGGLRRRGRRAAGEEQGRGKERGGSCRFAESHGSSLGHRGDPTPGPVRPLVRGGRARPRARWCSVGGVTTTSAPPAVSVPLLDLKKQYATLKDEILRVAGEVFESQGFILG